MTTGEKIKRLRKALLGINQEVFGKQLEAVTGKHKEGPQKYISRIENDERSPTIQELQTIAKLLKVRITDLSENHLDIEAFIIFKKSL